MILDADGSLKERLQMAMDEADAYYRKDISNLTEWMYYNRLFDLNEFANEQEKTIKSSVPK